MHAFPTYGRTMNEIFQEILRAERRIRPFILTTPLLEFSVVDDSRIFLKLESEQHTGSFKARGSINKILSLTNTERQCGVVTASTGNHGLGVAWSLHKVGLKGTIFVPENADPSKVGAIQNYGAEIRYTKANLSETQAHAQAKQYAKDHNMTWISPYNDTQVIAGQGTIAIELAQQLDDIDYVFVTVGGGGLISGIATYLRVILPSTKIIGCLPENSAEMYHSVQAGEFVHTKSKPSISDGSAGGFEEGSMTLPLCRTLVDDWTLVSEKEIKDAIRIMFHKHHKVIEGAAGVAVASLLKRQNEFNGKNILILVCGGNIAPQTLKDII